MTEQVRYVVAVHLGTLFTSGPAEVEPDDVERSLSGIIADIEDADGLLVIDGSFSDAISSRMNRAIAEKLREARQAGELAARVWGCDNEEPHYSGWEAAAMDGGFGTRHRNQEIAARAAWPFLCGATEIVITGAWATRDLSSGCVSSVLSVLRELMPAHIRVVQSESCLFEEYMDDPGQGDDPELFP
ncbi:hypothetical protein [Paracoccus sp. ME4]|uniref:hypothetical protein n=1 Tax=Paracoccus sp. ME4 TaxID=3138066 RepID=UPI00398B2AD2